MAPLTPGESQGWADLIDQGTSLDTYPAPRARIADALRQHANLMEAVREWVEADAMPVSSVEMAEKRGRALMAAETRLRSFVEGEG